MKFRLLNYFIKSLSQRVCLVLVSSVLSAPFWINKMFLLKYDFSWDLHRNSEDQTSNVNLRSPLSLPECSFWVCEPSSFMIYCENDKPHVRFVRIKIIWSRFSSTIHRHIKPFDSNFRKISIPFDSLKVRIKHLKYYFLHTERISAARFEISTSSNNFSFITWHAKHSTIIIHN